MESHRLILRELTQADTDSLFVVFSDPKTMQFTDTEPLERPEEAQREIRFNEELKSKGHGVRWGIFRKIDAVLLGTCGYHKWDRASRKAEIGFEICSAFWRQGSMSETLPHLIRYGFDVMNLNRIEALVFEQNDRSVSLLEKFGFTKEGLLREHTICKGQHWNEFVFSLLRSEWNG